MTKYLDSAPFTVAPGTSKAYRDNYDLVFGKKPEKEAAEPPQEEPAVTEDKPAAE